jgi:hypothetical protein
LFLLAIANRQRNALFLRLILEPAGSLRTMP